MPSTTRELGPIERFMTDDHERLDHLLETSLTQNPVEPIDIQVYAQFRHDLLQHIGREEKVLLPYARSKRADQPLPIAARLRADHGQIAKLLVPSPTLAIVGALRELLAGHNALEEGPAGVYAECDALAGDASQEVVARLRAQPPVPVAKHYDGPPHGPHGSR